ncbi:hypothetical protein WNY37_04830 [Henriciella sp. AS95]|uniref:hypothetical protein n=1 Tax=Henriciella sp. AS95 TaxID=3135782 RepID=UPI00317FF454
MMRTAAILTSAICGLGVTLPAHACTEFNLAAQQVGDSEYSPNNLSPVALQIEIFLIDGPAEASCASNVVEIESQTASGVRELIDGGPTISGTIPPGQSVFSSYTDRTLRLSQPAVSQLTSTGRLLFEYAWIEPGAFFPAGSYSNLLDVKVNGVPVDTVEPQLVVSPAMRLLGDVSDGHGQIDFETLESSEQITSNFIYQSNANLSVTAQSLNNGTLVHEDGPGVYSIPYAAFINDRAISTNGAQSLPLSSNMGAHNMGTVRLRVGDIGAPVAGDYADTLTLSFTTD